MGEAEATVLPREARLLLGEYDDLPMAGWAKLKPDGKWHQAIDAAGMVRFPCMSTVVPLLTVEMHDYRGHHPSDQDVCGRPHCQREVGP